MIKNNEPTTREHVLQVAMMAFKMSSAMDRGDEEAVLQWMRAISIRSTRAAGAAFRHMMEAREQSPPPVRGTPVLRVVK
ncbi:MAG: hypothetical protein AAFR04_11620 [Pseudomonadota bacterium]